jgi:hypothetical protein
MTLPKGYNYNSKKPSRRDYQDDYTFEDDMIRYVKGMQPLGPHVRRFETQEEAAAFNGQQQQPQQPPSQSGKGLKDGGKALMVLGALISILSFVAGSFGGGIFGFLLSIIGIALYAAGNKREGKNTSFFIGGVVTDG